MVIYTSDQGFFLGDHGWYDKRFMYEESLRMPFIVRYPGEIKAGSVSEHMILNLDFAATFVDYAHGKEDGSMQGKSIRPILKGEEVDDWRQSMYYRYWMYPSEHNVYAHYGIRTMRYKLICYYPSGEGLEEGMDHLEGEEWELFDLQRDPYELLSVYDDPDYAQVVSGLKRELALLKEEAGDFE